MISICFKIILAETGVGLNEMCSCGWEGQESERGIEKKLAKH